MTRPLQTPSGMPSTTPIPRMPDGSPVPQRKAAQMRAQEAARQAFPNETPLQARARLAAEVADAAIMVANEAAQAADDEAKRWAPPANAKVGPLDPAEADERLGQFEDDEEQPPQTVDNGGEVITEVTPERVVQEGEFQTAKAEDVPSGTVNLPPEPADFTDYKPAGVTLEGPGPDDGPRLETEEEAFERELAAEEAAKTATKPAVKKANPRQPAKKTAPKPVV